MSTVEVSREILNRFPIDQLVLIIAAGLTFTLLLPIDLLSFNLTDGLSIQQLNAQIYVNSFVQVKYLGNYYGAIQIFFLSLIFGLIIFVLQGFFEFINGKLMRGAFREPVVGPQVSDSERAEKHLLAQKFAVWAKRRNESRYIEFLWGISQATLGVLFAIEALFLVSLVMAIFALPRFFSILLFRGSMVGAAFCYITGKSQIRKIMVMLGMIGFLIVLIILKPTIPMAWTTIFFVANIVAYVSHKRFDKRFESIRWGLYETFLYERKKKRNARRLVEYSW